MGWLSFAFALAAGAFIAVQAGSNSQLKKSLGVPMPAVILNYLVGLTCIGLYTQPPRQRKSPPLPCFASKTTNTPAYHPLSRTPRRFAQILFPGCLIV